MYTPFAVIQAIAQDREDQLRKEAAQWRDISEAECRPRAQERFATLLRTLADRLDPEHNGFRMRTIEDFMEQ